LESPENWFEDFGSASLVDGKATVKIEQMFATTVNLSDTYHVFLTPLGDCALYVAEKTTESFQVRGLDIVAIPSAQDTPLTYPIWGMKLPTRCLTLETDPKNHGQKEVSDAGPEQNDGSPDL
jgi:hypothetical protein